MAEPPGPAGRHRTRADGWPGSARGRTGARPNMRRRSGNDAPGPRTRRHRRHRHEDVVGQQGHQSVDIGGFPGGDEPAATASSARRANGGRGPVGRRRGRLRRLARALLSALLTDSTVAPSISATSLGAEPEHVAEDERGELAGRQELQGGHEGQRDRFALLVAGLRAGRRVDGTLEEGVRVRLSQTTSPSRVGSGG